jgi:NO-binding membrane sensor protein with MHYT domain
MLIRIAAEQPELLAYGPVTPLLAYGMVCFGSAVGLRCAMRAPGARGRAGAGWLALGSVAFGTGVFTMHVVALIGFSVDPVPVGYDVPTLFGTLALAVAVSAVALLLISRRRHLWLAVFGGGPVLGLGVAATQYSGMTGMRIPGAVAYDFRALVIAALIAVVVTAVALGCATWIGRGHMGGTIAGALIMGAGFLMTHYTAMTGLTVRLYRDDGAVGSSSLGTLTTVLTGPMLVLLLVTLFVTLDPVMDRDGRHRWGTRSGETTGEKLEWTPFEQR